ncbi:MAG: YihA family ribosome biogenesis GTP-binding protein [Clostridiales bacterium]|nr:YihA family ribosome biogenesis GTP-binding protein [Clostridiales bacterium]
MEIKSAKFITSMAAYGNFTGKGLPQIAMAGRSNVGKSTLINGLCRSKGLAKTSGTPGKTRLINVFLLSDSLHLIDLPGYGYAKVAKQEKEKWSERMGSFFENNELLKVVVQLVDIRHAPSVEDVQMTTFLRAHDIPFILVATKSDKISKAARQRHIHPIALALAVQPFDIIPWSSETGEGREALMNALDQFL